VVSLKRLLDESPWCSLPANASGFDPHRASITGRFGQVTWEMWPAQEHGIRAVGGTTAAGSGIAEEPHIVPLLSVRLLIR
jgi:hypothetical protein